MSARQASANLRSTRSTAPTPPRVPPGRTTPVGPTGPTRSTPPAGARPRPTADTLANNPQIRAQTIGSPSGGGGGGAPAPVASGGSSRPRSIDWRDAAYNAQIAAIDRALRDFETGIQTRTQRYGDDFTRGVRDLGFRPGEGFIAAPDILQFRDLEEGLAAVRRPQTGVRGSVGEIAGKQVGEASGEVPDVAALRERSSQPITRANWRELPGGQEGDVMPFSGWDLEGQFNPFSSAARGTRSSRDDFAGRGVLRSSDFAQSFAEFQDRLNQQLEAMETGRGRFLEDALTSVSSQRATAEERRAAAQRDAVMRAAIQAGG